MGRSWSGATKDRSVKARLNRGDDVRGRTHTYETAEVGPVEVAFGRYGHEDSLFVTWRGEDLRGSYFWPDPAKREQSRDGRDYGSLLDDILTVEAEFQTRKRRDAIRKDAAKNPLPALLSPRAGGVHGGIASDRLEEVLVRGVDLRSGNALIIRADGSKENVRPVYLLADLDQHDRLDGARLYRAAIAAERVTRAALTKAKNSKDAADDALAARGIEDGDDFDVMVSIDFDTCERFTTFEGERIVRADARAVEDAVRARLVAPEWPLKSGSRYDDDGLVNVLNSGVGEHARLWRNADDYAAHETAAEASEAAVKAAEGWESEHLFDLSQFTGLNEEAERQARTAQVEQQETDEVATAIAKSIQAPEGAGDWDED